MAITKIIAIRNRLDKRVAYVINAEKTALDCGVHYIVNPEKTEQSFYTAVLNCGSSKTAYREMSDTKRRWRKTDGVQGYHFIQSFAPGEVTPEQAHKIGMEFATRLFGDKYEVVLGTHLDKAHLHNHIIVNSVSFLDGSKYHSSPASYYQNVRGTSDSLCREHELSVVSATGKGKHYAEWKADREGKPTIRGMIRSDIDRVISQAYTFSSFLMLLEREGYTVKHGSNRKYTTVRPPGAKRAIRLDSLGEDYTEEEIKQRLVQQRLSGGYHPMLAVKRCRMRGCYSGLPKRKIKGFLALYFRYVYLLRKYQRPKRRKYISFALRQEVIRLDRYRAQFAYLHTNTITTSAELEQRTMTLEQQITQMSDSRNELYKERRKIVDEADKERCSAEIDRQTASLRDLRRELALCHRIQSDIPQVSQQVRQAQEENEILVRKEEKQHEHKRRDR